jgi:hypothetical protein
MLHATVAAGMLASLLITPTIDTGRVSAASPAGPERTKSVTVGCPGDTTPFSGGGAIEYVSGDDGGVALTGIVPNVATRTVSVTATASPGHVGDWAVRGYAVCAGGYGRDTVTEKGFGSVVAACPPGELLFGLGFRTTGGRVTGVDIDEAVTRVRVTTGDGAEVAAVALCYWGFDERRMRTIDTSPGWPKVATLRDTDPYRTAMATGASVDGPPSAALDAIVPGPDDGVSWARGTLLDPPDARRSALDGEDDGSVTLTVSGVGTSY